MIWQTRQRVRPTYLNKQETAVACEAASNAARLYATEIPNESTWKGTGV